MYTLRAITRFYEGKKDMKKEIWIVDPENSILIYSANSLFMTV